MLLIDDDYMQQKLSVRGSPGSLRPRIAADIAMAKEESEEIVVSPSLTHEAIREWLAAEYNLRAVTSET